MLLIATKLVMISGLKNRKVKTEQEPHTNERKFMKEYELISFVLIILIFEMIGKSDEFNYNNTHKNQQTFTLKYITFL